jgi:hypothetical protein
MDGITHIYCSPGTMCATHMGVSTHLGFTSAKEDDTNKNQKHSRARSSMHATCMAAWTKLLRLHAAESEQRGHATPQRRWVRV